MCNFVKSSLTNWIGSFGIENIMVSVTKVFVTLFILHKLFAILISLNS